MVERFRPPVGYGKPPIHTQFEKGQSGNPRGRPRKTATASTILAEELQARVDITENGERRRITKLRALVKKALNAALSGGDSRLLLVLMRNQAAFEQLSQTVARNRSNESRLANVDLTRLSAEELMQLYHEMIATTRRRNE
jgi:hypothetical protein